MKNLINKIKEFFENRRIEKENMETEQRREKENIVIAPAGKWFNDKYNYAEGGINGEKETIESMRFGSQYGDYPIMLDVFPRGSAYVTSGRKEVVTSKNSPDGLNRIVLENPGKKIEYDAVIRYLEESPVEHQYFLNGDYVFTRKFTPSMGGGNPLDIIVNPTFSEDLVFSNSKPYYNRIEIARSLIEEMEKEVGRKIVDEKYYGGINAKEVYTIVKREIFEFLPKKIPIDSSSF